MASLQSFTRCSSLIKHDLMAMFQDFHRHSLSLFSLNFGVITLLPKLKGVKMIQQFRPICMQNVSFKIFTKVVANRLTIVANRIIRPSQSAFLPRRYILEGVKPFMRFGGKNKVV